MLVYMDNCGGTCHLCLLFVWMLSSGEAQDRWSLQEIKVRLLLQSRSERQTKVSQLLPAAVQQLFLAPKTRPPTHVIAAPDDPHFPHSLTSLFCPCS